MTASWNETLLPKILSKYKLEDIYNDDEFGLFYQSLPEKTLHLKSEKCIGGKLSNSKVRLTALAWQPEMPLAESCQCSLLVNLQNHDAFLGSKICLADTSRKKSWMDCDLFDEWVREIDRKFLAEKRKIALIVDNCPALPKVEGLKAIDLIFLPPNTTLKTQPMDQGIIRSLRARYRTKVIRKYIAAVNAKTPLPKLTVLDAMTMLSAAWNGVSETTVVNCFKKAGICKESQESSVNDDDDPFKLLAEEMNILEEKEILILYPVMLQLKL